MQIHFYDENSAQNWPHYSRDLNENAIKFKYNHRIYFILITNILMSSFQANFNHMFRKSFQFAGVSLRIYTYR